MLKKMKEREKMTDKQREGENFIQLNSNIRFSFQFSKYFTEGSVFIIFNKKKESNS
jgi:hypothetical protein